MLDAKTIAVSRKLGGGGGGGSDLARQIIDRTITEYSDNTITTIGMYAFAMCKNLESAKSSTVKEIGQSSFIQCSELESVEFPAATTIKSNAFQYCSKLVSATIPKAKDINGYAFNGCSLLESLDFHNVVYFTGESHFSGCSALKTMIFRSEDILSDLVSINILKNTPFASGKTGGKLLVPAALVESYKTAKNWSTIYGYGTNQFLALEDYTVDGTTTGAIDWGKVNAV